MGAGERWVGGKGGEFGGGGGTEGGEESRRTRGSGACEWLSIIGFFFFSHIAATHFVFNPNKRVDLLV